MSNQKVHQNFSFCIGFSCIHLSVTNFHRKTACGGRQWIMAHNWTLLHQSDIYWYQPVILKVWKGDVKQLIVGNWGCLFWRVPFFLGIPNLFLEKGVLSISYYPPVLHYSWYPIWRLYILLHVSPDHTNIRILVEEMLNADISPLSSQSHLRLCPSIWWRKNIGGVFWHRY